MQVTLAAGGVGGGCPVRVTGRPPRSGGRELTPRRPLLGAPAVGVNSPGLVQMYRCGGVSGHWVGGGVVRGGRRWGGARSFSACALRGLMLGNATAPTYPPCGCSFFVFVHSAPLFPLSFSPRRRRLWFPARKPGRAGPSHSQSPLQSIMPGQAYCISGAPPRGRYAAGNQWARHATFCPTPPHSPRPPPRCNYAGTVHLDHFPVPTPTARG